MLKQPVGFKKLTNVALIKLKKGKGRFEVACYKNKALDFRNGLEEDIDQVLQIDEIYSNAVSGELANKNDLEAAFPKMSKKEIIKMVQSAHARSSRREKCRSPTRREKRSCSTPGKSLSAS